MDFGHFCDQQVGFYKNFTQVANIMSTSVINETCEAIE